MEKRGQELSVGTLIIIVIGVIVLVLLVLGFSIGWEDLFAKIGIAQGSDLSAMVAACKVAAASSSKASFCECKNVRINGKAQKLNCGNPMVIKDDTTLSEAQRTFSCPATCT